jgi:hypothetical protein
MAWLGSCAKHEPGGEVRPEALLEKAQAPQILRPNRGARVYLDADDTTVGRFQYEIHLGAGTARAAVLRPPPP